jgi:osmoprotectant transport system substrate-binding protein
MRRAGPLGALPMAVAMLVASGCSGAGERPPPAEDPRRPVITVTSFDFSESETLAELYGQALRRQHYPVEVVARLGGRDIVQPALEQGRVDLVASYVGTALNFLYERRVATGDPRTTHRRLKQALAPRGLRVLAFAPAEDRNGFVVTGDLARRRSLERISDLQPIAHELVFGGPPECFDRPLCFKGLKDVYGLEFADFEPMPSRTVTADALETGEIHVGMIETTDGNLAERDLVPGAATGRPPTTTRREHRPHGPQRDHQRLWARAGPAAGRRHRPAHHPGPHWHEPAGPVGEGRARRGGRRLAPPAPSEPLSQPRTPPGRGTVPKAPHHVTLRRIDERECLASEREECPMVGDPFLAAPSGVTRHEWSCVDHRLGPVTSYVLCIRHATRRPDPERTA